MTTPPMLPNSIVTLNTLGDPYIEGVSIYAFHRTVVSSIARCEWYDEASRIGIENLNKTLTRPEVAGDMLKAGSLCGKYTPEEYHQALANAAAWKAWGEER